MIECTRCGNGVFSVTEMHLTFPQEHAGQGLMVGCQHCYSQRLIEESAQGNVDHQHVRYHCPHQQQGKREETCT